jgi:hypothetical protein
VEGERLGAQAAARSDVQPSRGVVAVALAGQTGLGPGSRGAIVKLPFEPKRGARLAVGDVLPLTVQVASLVYDRSGLVTVVPAIQHGSLEVVGTTPLGDLNASGAWDLADVVLVLRVVAGLTGDLTPLQEALADVNANGKADVRDALEVLRGLLHAKRDLELNLQQVTMV